MIHTQGGTELPPGKVLFILGANGAGKSRLMHHFFKQNSANAERIWAHRQSFLSSSGGELTPQSRRQIDDNVKSWNANANAAWIEHSPETRASTALFDIIEAENKRARQIADAVDADKLENASAIAAKDRPPIQVINELFRLSNLPITILPGDYGAIDAKRGTAKAYGINRLSDGERNALLLAAAVLTAKPGRLILIDEPERHLHRSIISPLLTHLFEKRKDCAFVVSTHDVTLVTDHSDAQVLLLRGCAFKDDEPKTWDADIVMSRRLMMPLKAKYWARAGR